MIKLFPYTPYTHFRTELTTINKKRGHSKKMLTEEMPKAYLQPPQKRLTMTAARTACFHHF